MGGKKVQKSHIFPRISSKAFCPLYIPFQFSNKDKNIVLLLMRNKPGNESMEKYANFTDTCFEW